jgi:hypothetical protein
MGKSWHGRTARAATAALILVAVGGLVFTSAPATVETRPIKPAVELSPMERPLPGTEAVEMFAAIDRGDLVVRLTPEKNQQARVTLENRTSRPLTVEVPPAFGARFILAAAGVAGAAPQPLGVGGGGTGGGMFCIPPEKVGYFRAKTACLAESQPAPTPGMVYEICRLEELAPQSAVERLCAMLGDGQTDPAAVQAAVWHLNCNLSWRQLAARLRSVGGEHGTQRWFTSMQIEEGKRLCIRHTPCAVGQRHTECAGYVAEVVLE